MGIRSEFESRLITWALAQSPSIPVSIEGVAFTKPLTTPFLECYLMPAGTTNPTVDAKRARHRGIFQVNCWVKDNNKGSKVIDDLAQDIVDLFPVYPKWTTEVSVEQTPSRSQAHLKDGWRCVSVTVIYRQDEVI